MRSSRVLATRGSHGSVATQADKLDKLVETVMFGRHTLVGARKQAKEHPGNSISASRTSEFEAVYCAVYIGIRMFECRGKVIRD